MKAEEIHAKSDSELQDLVGQLKRELLNLRFQQATGELENTARFKDVRRTIARANTVLQERTKKAA
jgi:large subunit ribosomal protein L29